MLTKHRRIVALLFLLTIGGAAPAAAEVFCAADGSDPRIEMTPTFAQPWSAVGYLNNGCTATLISQSFLLTAGHCITNVADGSWQQGLSFFPNYHPSVTGPSVSIDRAVVGARGDIAALDWAIAHLETPVTSHLALKLGDPPSAKPFSVSLGGYGRDLNRTSPKPVPPGAACSNAFCPGGNVWWDAALIQPQCSVRSETARELLTDCAAVGGNSGSPFIRKVPVANSRTFEYQVVGVIHGGSPALLNWSSGAPTRQQKALLPACTPLSKANVAGNLNVGPSARRFRNVPFFAAGVAVAQASAKSPRSVVFASDTDSSRVVVRERTGATVKDPFSDHRSFGFLLRPTRLAALRKPDGNPAIAAVASNGRLFVRRLQASGEWDNWGELTLPAGVTSIVDIDGLGAELYAVGSNGLAYRTRLNGEKWDPWLALGGTGVRRITAVSDTEGIRHVVTLSASGVVTERVQDGKSWSNPFKPPVAVGGAKAMRDVDAVREASGRLHLFAVDSSGAPWNLVTARSYAKPEGSGQLGWGSWAPWDVHLYLPPTPGAQVALVNKKLEAAKKYGFLQEVIGPRLDGVSTLTAHYLPEKAVKGMASLVVFATDDAGNVYSTGQRCAAAAAASCYWSGWRPFTD